MATSRWHQLRTLLDQALALPGEEREQFLRERCADDPELFDEVHALLKEYERSGQIPDDPSVDETATRLMKPKHSDPLVGKETDDHRILSVLGRGGMGVVYKALNLSLNRVEALKVIMPALVRDEELLHRFRVEAQALARIHHPNIVTIHTLRQSEIGAYITMEYVEGRTLANIISREGAFHWERALPLFRQMLEAFDYAHRRGIIHRDVKPGNIMVNAEGQVKVMDFGLAKLRDAEHITRTGITMGTMAYMSPEQIKGFQLDERTDLFSLGLTMHEMLTGERAFRAEHEAALMYLIVNEEPDSLQSHLPEAPPELFAFLKRSLEKEPDRRYRNAQEMLDALQVLEGELPTLPAGGATSWSKPPSRWPPWGKQAAAAAAGMLLLLGLGWAAVVQGPSLLGVAPASEDQPVVVEDRVEEEPDEAPETRPEEESEPEDEEPDPVQEPEPEPEREQVPAEPTQPTTDAIAEMQERLEQEQQEAPSVEEEAGPEADEAPEENPEPEDEPAPEVEEEPESEAEVPGPSAEEIAIEEARRFRALLVDAIMEDSWDRLPEPVASFYQSQLAPLARRFNIMNVGIEIEDFRVQSGAGRTQLPVTVRIDYQQRGRDGIQSVPIPAVWIWLERNGRASLEEVTTR